MAKKRALNEDGTPRKVRSDKGKKRLAASQDRLAASQDPTLSEDPVLPQDSAADPLPIAGGARASSPSFDDLNSTESIDPDSDPNSPLTPPPDSPKARREGNSGNPFGGWAATKADGTPRKPKATKKEKQEILDMTIHLFKARNNDRTVLAVLKASYNLSASWARRYIQKARKRMREELGKLKEDHQVDAYSVYRSVIEASDKPQIIERDNQSPIVIQPQVQPRDRILAQSMIDKLLGLAAPIKLDVETGQKADTEAMEALRTQAVKDPVLMELLLKVSERMQGFTPPADPIPIDACGGPGIDEPTPEPLPFEVEYVDPSTLPEESTEFTDTGEEDES